MIASCRVTSLVLRDRPDLLGVDLLPGGWVSIEVSIDGAARQDHTLTRELVVELERFTTCGDPSLGFACLKWPPAAPASCGGRRMTERAARWIRELIPRVAVRQCCPQPVWSTGVAPGARAHGRRPAGDPMLHNGAPRQEPAGSRCWVAARTSCHRSARIATAAG